jgi:ABC-type bacteriocin/lantibiotic exporter with double-glycine peptidase domain
MTILRRRELAKRLRNSQLSEIWVLLDKRDRLVLKLVILVQVLLSVLDLIGVALIGVIGALSVYGIQSQDSGNFARAITDFIGLENFTFQNQVLVLSVLTISILLTKTAASLWITRRSLRFISRRGARLSGLLLRNVLTRPSTEINSYSQQELIYSATAGVQSLTTGIIGISVSTVADLSLLVILTVGLSIYNPILAVTTFSLFITVGAFLSYFLRNKAFKVGSIETKSHVQSNEVMSEVLNTYREAVVRDTRESYVQDFEVLRLGVASALAKRTFMPFASKYVMEVSMIGGAFLIAGIQFALYDSKTATAGLAIFFGASSRIAPAILRIQQGTTQIRTYLGQSQTSLELLRVSGPIQTNPGNGLRLLQPDFDSIGFLPEIIVNDLAYRYSTDSSFCLRIPKLVIKPNQHVAIVGESGSGKTTLVDLMLGILAPNSGEVNISGIAPTLAFRQWPGAVGYVPQETIIASGSIMQNVALGYDFKTSEISRVKKCLRLAGLHEFTSEDELGIYLQTGGAGHKLSGGQRQRLGIARALYTNPKLLVMDEATSSLDSATEFDITQALAGLKKDLTLVTIAHRLSTVQAADIVLYMQNGEVLASGSFEEVRDKVKAFDLQANLLGL